ncbi:MAG: POTRA domain-containing protein [Verrucomicrobiota bacterium]
MLPNIIRMPPAMRSSLAACFCNGLILWGLSMSGSALHAGLSENPAPTTPQTNNASGTTNLVPSFLVERYELRGTCRIPQDVQKTILSRRTGTNVSLMDIVKTSSDLILENRTRGYPPISIGLADSLITNGVVTLNVFRGDSRVIVSGKRYDPPIPVAATNPPPFLRVTEYQVTGDTLLSGVAMRSLFAKYTGTNVTVKDIVQAASDLQMEYRNRGYPTVNVTLPPQQITNGVVQIRVFVGHLSSIEIAGNKHFSSNNIIRALPSLHTNLVLNSPVFQAELDRANANQDRQIYPQLEPGDEENTTRIRLDIKDRFPLHGKVELNNQSSPGTPDLRLNTSAAYNNLWQLDHSAGLQYSFSPEAYKSGDQWAFYDRALVANYSAYYRLPFGSPEAIASTIASKPGTFGYSEATRKFNLPPPSGRPDLSVYASRSTIDTGIMTLSSKAVLDIPRVISISEKDVQEDLTINSVMGTRFNLPLPATGNFQSSLSGGLDYKTYGLDSSKTNNFLFSITTRNANGSFNAPISATVPSPVPATHRPLEYLPISLHYDASLRDKLGSTSVGLGVSGNAAWSGSITNLQQITGSTKSSGNWVTVTPSISREFIIRTNWALALRAEGQWASEPLISNEQFGNGGVASIPGYREGEVFGDTGWRVNMELKTPAHLIGLAYAKHDLRIRGSLFMDYGSTYLLDPSGRNGSTPLCGTGLGAVATIGNTWDLRFLFSWPLLSTPTTAAYQPFFNFGIAAQF